MKLPDKNSLQGKVLFAMEEILNQKHALEHGAYMLYNLDEFKSFVDDENSEEKIQTVINDNIQLLSEKDYFKKLKQSTTIGLHYFVQKKDNLYLEDLYKQEAEAEEEQAKQIQKQKEAEELDKKSKKNQIVTNCLLALTSCASLGVSWYGLSQNRNSDTKYNQLEQRQTELQHEIKALQIELQHLKEKPTPQVQSK
jgi:hypothetical protein